MKEKKSLHVEMGQRIRNRRKELKWSRETLSEKTDVSARFLACVENGQSGLSLESLGRMSCALGVSTDFLLFGSGTAPIPNDLADALASIPPDYHDLLVKQVRLFSDIMIDLHFSQLFSRIRILLPQRRRGCL